MKIDTLLTASGLASGNRISSPLVDAIINVNDSGSVSQLDIEVLNSTAPTEMGVNGVNGNVTHTFNSTKSDQSNNIQFSDSSSASSLSSSQQNVNNRTAGNPIIINKPPKEAMTQNNSHLNETNIKIVPESSKIDGQKRLSPNLSVDGPRIGSVGVTADKMSSSARTSAAAAPDYPNCDNLMNSSPIVNLTDQRINREKQIEIDALNAMLSLDALNEELHVTKFTNSTTCDDIMKYLQHRQLDLNKIKVFRLTKKNQDVTMLSFVSFKIETNKEIANKLLQSKFWPKGSYAKKFVKKDSSISDLGNFLARISTIQQFT